MPLNLSTEWIYYTVLIQNSTLPKTIDKIYCTECNILVDSLENIKTKA